MKTKELIILIVLIITLSGCSNHNTKSVESPKIKKDTVKNEQIEALVDSAFFDDGEAIYPDTFYLKNNYILYTCLSKDENSYKYSFKLIGNCIDTAIWENVYEGNLGTKKYLPYFDGIDFDDYFGISQSGGGNCSLYINLFEKKTGRNVLVQDNEKAIDFKTYQGNYDLKNNLLVYLKYDSENIVLFDLKNNKKTTIEENFNDPCFGTMCNFSFYTFRKVTDKTVTLEYYNNGCKRRYQFKISR